MREILFRAKRVDNGEWETGSIVVIRGGCSDERVYIADKMTGYLIPVIPETVGEFTGLCDKNGKKIFEGDIIEMSFNGGQVELRAQVKYSGAEGYYFLSGIAKDKGWTGHYGYGNPIFVFEKIFNIKVIGNIHDNKELLEVEE